MSRPERYSFLEVFLQKTVPRKSEKELTDTKKSLRNKPVMMVAEKKEKVAKKTGKKKKRITGRILAKPTNSNYQDYEVLRKLWREYMTDLLADYQAIKPGESVPSLDIKNAQEAMLKADYHGADLTVTHSRCSSHRGISGTVLQETKNLFLVCTKKNRLVKIPKSKTIFALDYPDGYSMTIFGSQFCYKPAHRLVKRFNKNPNLKELLNY